MSKVEWVYSIGRMSILTGQSKCMGRLGTLGRVYELTGYSDCTGQTRCTDWVE